MIQRRPTRQITLGPVKIGGGAPISVQSMIKTDTSDLTATLNQVRRLAAAGCEIVRIAVKAEREAETLRAIVAGSPIPVVADIHFDHRLAIASVKAGVAGLRINPGNIGSESKTREVVAACKDAGIPIRIGVNAGSLEKRLLAKHGGATPKAMVESALDHVSILERMGFQDIKLSLKAADVPRTVEAYREASNRVDYPLHLGITEAGTFFSGTVVSSVGLGILLAEGIGDTIRVSLTADPVDEVRVGFEILRALGLREPGIRIVSCPTCGRLESDKLLEVVEELERSLASLRGPLHLAVMGCSVNGPGEAKEADLGVVAAPRGEWHIYRSGHFLGKVQQADVARVVLELVSSKDR